MDISYDFEGVEPIDYVTFSRALGDKKFYFYPRQTWKARLTLAFTNEKLENFDRLMRLLGYEDKEKITDEDDKLLLQLELGGLAGIYLAKNSGREDLCDDIYVNFVYHEAKKLQLILTISDEEIQKLNDEEVIDASQAVDRAYKIYEATKSDEKKLGSDSEGETTEPKKLAK